MTALVSHFLDDAEFTGVRAEDRAGWLALRRTMVTASDVAAILGEDQHRSALSVYVDKITERQVTPTFSSGPPRPGPGGDGDPLRLLDAAGRQRGCQRRRPLTRAATDRAAAARAVRVRPLDRVARRAAGRFSTGRRGAPRAAELSAVRIDAGPRYRRHGGSMSPLQRLASAQRYFARVRCAEAARCRRALVVRRPDRRRRPELIPGRAGALCLHRR